jgi:formylglycine-generating enzyme required for sulfatase activity
MRTSSHTLPAIVLLSAALLLSACAEESLGPPECDAALRDGAAAGSWIRVEPGSFTMGVNEDFYQWYFVDRGNASEVREQMRATITRPYVAMATEVTNEMWDDVFDANPTFVLECPTCPVEFVRRADALMFANALSERDGLTPCYDLSRCTGEPGTRVASCPADIVFDLECEGYRLPTAGEFEYLARAGTTTSHHCGELQLYERDQCLHDHEWTGDNWRLRERYPAGALEVQPVATLCPNDWGFYDVGGNVAEHVWDVRSTDLPEPWAEEVVDPIRPLIPGESPSFQHVGDTYNGGILGLAASGAVASIPANSSLETLKPIGFRLVRTVPVGER